MKPVNAIIIGDGLYKRTKKQINEISKEIKESDETGLPNREQQWHRGQDCTNSLVRAHLKRCRHIPLTLY